MESPVIKHCTTTPIIPIPSPDQAACHAPVSCLRSPVEAHLFPEYPRAICGAPDCFVCSRALFCGAPENANWRYQVKKVLATHFSEKKNEIPQLERKRRRDPWFNDHYKKLRKEAEDRVATEAAIVQEHVAFQAQLHSSPTLPSPTNGTIQALRDQFVSMKALMQERVLALQQELDELQAQLDTPDNDETQFNNMLSSLVSNLEHQADEQLAALRQELTISIPAPPPAVTTHSFLSSELISGDKSCSNNEELFCSSSSTPSSSSSSTPYEQDNIFSMVHHFDNLDMAFDNAASCFIAAPSVLLDGVVNM